MHLEADDEGGVGGRQEGEDDDRVRQRQRLRVARQQRRRGDRQQHQQVHGRRPRVLPLPQPAHDGRGARGPVDGQVARPQQQPEVALVLRRVVAQPQQQRRLVRREIAVLRSAGFRREEGVCWRGVI